MAVITSVTNFVGTKSWTDTSAWTGGVVPGIADTAQIRGIRTTINQTAFPAWVGTKIITVASTTGFPTSGTFYTCTERNAKIKIDYTGLTATTFTGCTIDTSYYPWTINNTPTFNLYGGNIANGAYVHFTPIIEINNITVEAGIIIIENGGYFKIHNNGNLGFRDYIVTRDGTFHVSGSATIRFELNNIVAASGTMSRIYGENYQLSRILFEGNDPRLKTTLTSPASINDGKLTVSSTSGFEINDYIMVKDPNINIQRLDDGFRSAFSDITGSIDECFNVVGKSGNDLYVSRMNSIDVTILGNASNTNTIITDSTRLEAGGKVVINNAVYTIQSVSDYDYQLRDYDFTQAGTTLDDWETDVTRSAYFADFRKSATPVSGSSYALIQHATTAYRHLFVKNLMRQEVKIEAWISNFQNVTSGVNDGGELGIVMHADPLMDYDYAFDTFARTYSTIDKDNARYRLLQRAVSSDSTVSTTRANVPVDGLRKFTLECRKGLIKSYINDNLVNESFMRSGGYFGRMGVFCNAQNAFTCTQFKIYAAAQQLVLDRNITVSDGDKVYETGVEFVHKTGDIVVKQASTIEDPLSMDNLAYGYGGAREYRGDYIFPYLYNASTNNTNLNTRNTNTIFYSLLNNQQVFDLTSGYSFASNDTTTGSMIVDLATTRTFTHITFQEYYRATGQFASTGGYINFQTSNNLNTWTTINCRTGSEAFAINCNDNQARETGDSIRSYELQTTQTARYIRITRAGANNTSTVENRWSTVGVRNMLDGYKIKLNNVSDFSVNDRVMPMYNGGYNGYISETNFYTTLLNGTFPSTRWTNQLKEYYTVQAVDTVNKTITLDRPYTHSYLEGGEKIYNLTRGIKLRGDRGTNIWKQGRWNIYPGGQTNGRRHIIKNTEFTGFATYYPTNNSSNYDISSFGHRNYGLFEADIYDGITNYDNFPQQTSYNSHFYSASNYIVRDSVWLTWNGRGWFVYFPSQYSTSYFSGNLYANSIYGDNTFFGSVMNVYWNYNNVYGGNYGVQIPRVITQYSTNTFNTPIKVQIKRNYNNGGQGYGFGRGENAQGFGSNTADWDWDSNMFEYMDDGLSSNYRYVPYWHKNVILPKRGNTDNRLTRYRNEGTVAPDRMLQQHIASPHFQNYNKWGYDLIYQGDYTYTIKEPNDDYFKIYRVTTEWRNALFGTTFQIKDSSSVNFNYAFEYRHDVGQFALNANTYTGSMVFFTLKDGIRSQNDIVLPKVTGSFVYTTGSISVTGPGLFNIGVGQAALNGYVAVRNMNANIVSTNPSNLYISSNTFDLSQLASPYPRDYTTGNYTIDINLL
jgi:hypothetical protein